MKSAKAFLLFLLLTLPATVIAAELQGPSTAVQGDLILLRVSDDVAADAQVELQFNGERQPEGFKFTNRIIEIANAQVGEYRIVVQHNTEQLAKSVSVSTKSVAGAAAADDELIKEIVKLKSADNDPAFAKNCETLAKEFAMGGLSGGNFKIAKLTDNVAGLNPIERAWSETINAIVPRLKQLGFTDETAQGQKLAELLRSAAGEMPSAPQEPEEIALGGAQPAATSAPLAVAVRERLFQMQVNDFDPRFQETCQSMATAVTEVIKRYENGADDDVPRFRTDISTAVRGVIETVRGTEVGEAKRRWNQFYDEYRFLLHVLELPLPARPDDDKRAKLFDDFQRDAHAYAGIVTADLTIGRTNLAEQRKAFEAFAAGLGQSVERDKQEVEAALNRYGLTSQSGAAAGSSLSGGMPYGGRLIDRLFIYKMRAMEHRHHWRMSRFSY